MLVCLNILVSCQLVDRLGEIIWNLENTSKQSGKSTLVSARQKMETLLESLREHANIKVCIINVNVRHERGMDYPHSVNCLYFF